jgi:hypothetical protein
LALAPEKIFRRCSLSLGSSATKHTPNTIVFRNPTQVQLICGDPRYKQMSPKEVIGKFVSFELMIKHSKHIVNLEQGTTSTPEVQPVAFKATKEKKEEPTPTNRLPIDASKLDNEEMALIIKSFRQILKQRNGKDYKPRYKRVHYRCGKFGHYMAKCPYTSDSDRDDDKEGKKKMEKKKYYNKKKGGEAHIGQELDSDESSTDSSDEDAANIAINKGLLFPNVSHKCIMAKHSKKKKVHSRDTPKYTTSDDEGSSNEKDAYTLEVEKCENLTKELNICNDSIYCLRTKNVSLISKVEELNACKVSTSTIEHVTICTRCRDINVDAMNDHLPIIKEQNDHIAKLNANIAEHELENKKIKFARSMLYNGRCPGIKDGIGFQPGSQSNIKLNAHRNKLSNFVKGKPPMVQDREGYILYPKTIQSIRLEKFMLRNLILLLIMLISTVMRLLALGIQLILKCLRKRLLMHQMNIAFHLKPLMHHLFL